MKESLRLRSVRIGTEDHFPRVGARAGQRMHIHKQRVVHAVELDRLAVGRVDQMRMPEHVRRDGRRSNRCCQTARSSTANHSALARSAPSAIISSKIPRQAQTSSHNQFVAQNLFILSLRSNSDSLITYSLSHYSLWSFAHSRRKMIECPVHRLAKQKLDPQRRAARPSRPAPCHAAGRPSLRPACLSHAKTHTQAAPQLSIDKRRSRSHSGRVRPQG